MSLLNGLFPIATDSEGRTLPRALLYSYDVGTFTPKATYSDVGLTLPNANPLEADGSGWFPSLYLGAGGYKLVLADEFGTVIKTQDNYYSNLTGADLANIDADIAETQQMIAKIYLVCSDTSVVADVYTLVPAGVSVAPDAYSSLMSIFFSPNNNNTGASIVNVSGLGDKDLVNSDGSPLPADFLMTGYVYQFIYFGSVFAFYGKSGQIETFQIADKAVSPAKMQDGTNYALMGYSSAGEATSYTNPMRLLTSGTFSVAANISFVLSMIDTDQSVNNGYLIRFVGFQPASDDKELYITISSDGGATYLAGAGYYGLLTGYDSGGNIRTIFSSGAAQLSICGASVANMSMSNAANETGFIDIYLFNFNTGTSLFPIMRCNGGYWAATANDYVVFSSGGSNNAGAADFDAVKFTWESGGDFTAVGQYYLFKIPNII